jgi:hypothetical protein
MSAYDSYLYFWVSASGGFATVIFLGLFGGAELRRIGENLAEAVIGGNAYIHACGRERVDEVRNGIAVFAFAKQFHGGRPLKASGVPWIAAFAASAEDTQGNRVADKH